MDIAVIKSRALAGMQAPEVSVEVHLANGLPAFAIAGAKPPQRSPAQSMCRATVKVPVC